MDTDEHGLGMGFSTEGNQGNGEDKTFTRITLINANSLATDGHGVRIKQKGTKGTKRGTFM
jgi:hypothetical protein